MQEKQEEDETHTVKCCCSTSAKSCCRCIIMIRLRLLDKRVCVNLRRAHNFLKVITSQECLAATQHMAGLLHDIHCVCRLCACMCTCLTARRDTVKLERTMAASEDITSSHLYPSLSFSLSPSLYTNHLLYFSSAPILAIWYFGCHLSLLSDLL